MSDYHASHEASTFGLKFVLGVILGFFGAITLDQVAIVAGIMCSLVITGHTGWKWWNEWRDRVAKKKAAAPETGV